MFLRSFVASVHISGAALALVSLPAAALDDYKALPTAYKLDADIKEHGAAEVLKALWGNDDTAVFWKAMQKVETGRPEWLRLAVTLRGVSDAGASEALEGAMSAALPSAPKEVLRIVSLEKRSSAFSVAFTCGANFYLWEEDPPGKTDVWFARAEKAVRSISVPDLIEKREACLKEMKKSQEQIREHAKTKRGE